MLLRLSRRCFYCIVGRKKLDIAFHRQFIFSLCTLQVYMLNKNYMVVAVTSSLWSPKMRFRKSETIKGRPLRSSTFGCQPSKSLAFVISGFLLCGSSSVLALYSIFASGSIVSWTTCNKNRQ